MPSDVPVAAFIYDAETHARLPAASLHIIYEGESVPEHVPMNEALVVDLDTTYQVSAVMSRSADFQPIAAATVRDSATGDVRLEIQGTSRSTWKPSGDQSVSDIFSVLETRNKVLSYVAEKPKTGKLINPSDLLSGRDATSASLGVDPTLSTLARTPPSNPYRAASQDGTAPTQWGDATSAAPAGADLHAYQAKAARQLQRVETDYGA